jgi:maleate cis-trans isomerase
MENMMNSPTGLRTISANVSFPTCRIGYINPLDIIDTSPYEFYRLAPSNAIASMVSIGLTGFSGDAASQAVEQNLTRCLSELAKRKVEFVVLGGLPMLYNLGDDYSELFRSRCQSEFGLRGATSVDAANAALTALGAKQVVVINKWNSQLNQKVAQSLSSAGFNLIGAATEEHTAEQVKSAFEQGADVALKLAERAMTQFPQADCLFIAGGAWLVGPFVAEIERQFGVSVVAGQQAKIWYSLNMVKNHIDRPEYGRLMTVRIPDAR